VNLNDKSEQQTSRIADDFPRPIRRTIANLRNVIDQFGTNSKELVIELARGINEKKICERNKISRLIKYILKDKIREGKITAKWIEDCLPEDYKRRYSKSEETSLSSKVGKLQGCPRCLELEEALRKASKISTAEQLVESEIKVTIFKNKYEEIKSAIQESGDLFHIIVDSVNRILVRAEVDLKDDIIAD
jgi:hypothetical protein